MAETFTVALRWRHENIHGCITMASDGEKLFCDGNNGEKVYKQLVNCCLALLILFNRRRIGDVQFLKLDDYKRGNTTNYVDFKSVLTQTESVILQR